MLSLIKKANKLKARVMKKEKNQRRRLRWAKRELHRSKEQRARSCRDRSKSSLMGQRSNQSKSQPSLRKPPKSPSNSRLVNGIQIPSCWPNNMKLSTLDQVRALFTLAASDATTETWLEQSKTITCVSSARWSMIRKISRVWPTNGLLRLQISFP